MVKVIEKERIIKNQSAKVMAWKDGELVEVYFSNARLHGSTAKYIRRELHTISSVRGRVYQNDEGKVYFLPNR